MNSQDFLTLNLVGAGAFVLWYLLSRGGARRPTQLNLHAKDSAPPILPPEEALVTSLQRSVATPNSSTPATAQSYRSPHIKPEATPEVKVLNVMFNYNGHSWDAYEVLGVPAGASLRMVTEAYQLAIQRSAKESLEFLETAYSAILNAKTRL
ncbi:hypothetical protein BDW_03935 [Bdellovibrio bacteriovorus W]|nr:hypothetical protein BDW_03935 [Bdellovibrio bacteriovorus W]